MPGYLNQSAVQRFVVNCIDVAVIAVHLCATEVLDTLVFNVEAFD